VRKPAVALMMGLGLLLLGSCGSGSSPSGEGAVVVTTAAAPAGAYAATFCTVFATLPTDTPESYVGSSEHLADVERLLAASPSAIAPQVESFRVFVASGAITSDPASKDTANFPPSVRQAIDDIRAYASANC
jgi:hypothetical protein